MANADPPAAPLVPEPSPARPAATRVLCLGALLVMLGFVGTRSPTLWGEWLALNTEWANDRESRVVGYVGIHPTPSYALPPKNWYHDEGGKTLLWSGWVPGVGHDWFRVDQGEIDRQRLSEPFGRDIIRAIHRPLVEVGGGKIWDAILAESEVAGLQWSGLPVAYPRRVLEKVEVVNDTLSDRPVLVVFTPFVPSEQAVQVFDPVRDGRTIRLGSSGYFLDGRPLLYDQDSESLWTVQGATVVARAGRLKGTILPSLASVAWHTWGSWKSRHPQTRLLVGADRSQEFSRLTPPPAAAKSP